jgi:hypothetical protein
LAHFVFVGAALAVGEGEVAAGDGLATGLGLVAGAVVSAGVFAGDDAAGDDAGVGEFELAAGSHAAAKAITRIVVNSSAVRLIDFNIGLLIVFPLSNRIEKRDDDCPKANCQQWVFPQALRRGLPLSPTEALVLIRVPATNRHFAQQLCWTRPSLGFVTLPLPGKESRILSVQGIGYWLRRTSQSFRRLLLVGSFT